MSMVLLGISLLVFLYLLYVLMNPDEF
ncbi:MULTISPECIES: potassium-transporting ATPase subunit F [Bacillaceae]|nr:potassium-transporting ATPase subunit F [Bacillus sp. CBEL-1]